MSNSGSSIATPIVQGVLAAVISVGTALALVVIPALAAQVAGTRSTATALDAILIGLNVLVLGHGGGVLLSTGTIDGAVTLTPFGLMGVLILITALGMRRVGRALDLVRADGVLRRGALTDAGSALGAYTAVYAAAVAVLAAIGRSTDASPVITSAVVSGALVALVGGLGGVLWSLRREATDDVPGVHVLGLLPAPFDAVARAALMAVLGLFAVGMLVTAVMLALTLPAQTALFDELQPGAVGGIVLTLLHLALLPLLAVWVLVVLLGGSITVGTGTVISLGGAETGVLPALPILAALPRPGEFPGWAWALLVLPAVPIALGTIRLVGDVQQLPMRSRALAWGSYPAAVIVAVLLIAGLSTGGIGDGRLVHLGPHMSSLALPLVLLVAGTTALVLGILATPLIPWVRSVVAALRERVESAERKELAEREERADEEAADDDESTDEEPAELSPRTDH